MSKLIYAPSSSVLETSYPGIRTVDPSTNINPTYYSVAFTGDGFMYTHGKKFKLFLVLNDGLTGISFSVLNGTAQVLIDGTSVGSGSVILSITGDNIVNAVTTNGATALTHKLYLDLNNPTLYGSNTLIPIITVDKYGHITAVSNGSNIDVTVVQAGTTQTAGNYYLTGVTNSNTQNPIYSTGAYIDQNGNLYVASIHSGGSDIATLFAPLSHTSVTADDSTLGHVYLFDTPDSDKDINAAYAATPKAVASALSSAQQYTRDLMAALDAMVFVGTVEYDGTILSYNDDVLSNINLGVTKISNIAYKTGYTFRFASAGTFGTEPVEIGDMIIAVKSFSTEFKYTDWTIIQTNISGALTATSTLNGLLYALNSRTILALTLSNGVLTSDGAALSFVNSNTLWRTIKVNDTSIGTNELNLKTSGHVSYSVNNGEVTLSINDSAIIATSASLSITKDNTTFSYNPSTASTLYLGDMLTLSDITVNGVTAKQLNHATTTRVVSKLGKVTTDNYGHVTGVEEVTSIPNTYSFIIKNNSGTSLLTYKGDADKILKIIDGTDIALSLAVNASTQELELTPSVVHKYRPILFYGTSSAQSPTSLINTNSSTTFTLVAGNNITLTHLDGQGSNLSDGTLVIHADDTWRNIEAYSFSGNSHSRSSIGSGSLKFDDSLLYSNDEIGLCWTEIDDLGVVTYTK